MPGLEVLTATADRFGIPGQGDGGRPDRRVGEQALQTATVRVMPAVIRASAHAAAPVARCAFCGELTPLTLNIHRIAVLHLGLRKVFLEFADIRCGSLQLIGEMLDLNNGLDPDGELLEVEGFGDKIVSPGIEGLQHSFSISSRYDYGDMPRFLVALQSPASIYAA